MGKDNIIKIIEQLKKAYPEAKCSLNFSTPFELVVAVALSAQCTDERVNKVTKEMFKKYNTPQDFANLELEEIENLIKPCGFYKNKAKNLKACSQKLLKDFNGIVPQTMEELITLPGIGRKSANVILLDAFDICVGVAVDTHAKRLSNRIGFSTENEPLKIEMDLIKKVPKEYLKYLNHLLVFHGRNTCTARNPDCKNCVISTFCKFCKNK